MNHARDIAHEYLQKAYQRQMEGDVEQALLLYSLSIEACPTAEAYTFRGWAYSFLGDLNQAIAECEQAIELDPGYGNPYNDIGAYLLEQGRLDEALHWLERATQAPRLQHPCMAHFNLGRAWEAKRQHERARQCYLRALQENPKYKLAWVALGRLLATSN